MQFKYYIEPSYVDVTVYDTHIEFNYGDQEIYVFTPEGEFMHLFDFDEPSDSKTGWELWRDQNRGMVNIPDCHLCDWLRKKGTMRCCKCDKPLWLKEAK